jgi:hypothetical protein
MTAATTAFQDQLKLATTPEQVMRINQFNELLADNIDKRTRSTFKAGCRNMYLCFKDGQQIRHRLAGDVWIGTYKKSSNTIHCEDNGKVYDKLHSFALAHLNAERPDRATKTINAWRECETEVEPDKWISTFMLPELSESVLSI